MNKIILTSILSATILFSSEQSNEADCIIAKEENSIICKYSAKRETEDRLVKVEWIDPEGKVSRVRQLNIPKGYGSVYDFRYVQGRLSGTWTFTVKDKEEEYATKFEIE